MTITAAHHNSYSLPGILLHVVVGAPTWRECHGYRTATAMAGRLLHVDTASGFLLSPIENKFVLQAAISISLTSYAPNR